MAGFSDAEILALEHDWGFWARREQLPPKGNWTTWLLMGGRGSGKTRAGAEWVRHLANQKSAIERVNSIALVGETMVEARAVMVEGPAGLLNVGPLEQRPAFDRSRNMLKWPNGVNAQLMCRLSGLLRGQDNTMAGAAKLADAGNAFAFINGSTASAPVSNDQLDLSIFATAFAGNFDLVGQSVEILLSQDLARPFAPVHARAKRNGGSQDIILTWHRRTQVGGDSWAGSDVPLDFSPEAYQLSIFDGATLVRQIEVSAAQYIYSSADQTTDLGAALSPFTFEVRQLSAVHGTGAALSGSFSS